MVESTDEKLRHFCRNPKCRSKLAKPIADPRAAFCTDGCHDRFYRLRCYICEEMKPGRLDAQTCGRLKCKNAMRALKTAKDTSRVEIGVGKSTKSGVPEAPKTGRPWHIVAGPRLSPSTFHCATVADGGEHRRIEAKNTAAMKAAEQADIANSGYFTEPDWQEVVSPDGVRCYLNRFRPGAAAKAQIAAASVIPDDLSIPAVLDRRKAEPKPELLMAA
jgi:hypothetical protein